MKIYVLYAGYDGAFSFHRTHEAAQAAWDEYVDGSLVGSSERWWERFGPGRHENYEDFLELQKQSIRESWYIGEEELLS